MALAIAPSSFRHVVWEGPAMGGQLAVHVSIDADADASTERRAVADAARVGGRVRAWAARLSRFEPGSELCRLNAGPTTAAVRPALARVLQWAAEAAADTEGIVDVSMLDARIAAEEGAAPVAESTVLDSGGTWAIRGTRRGGIVSRDASVRFDVDGVAKGWLADRALGLLASHQGGLVDADGDVALRVAAGETWIIAVADPRADDDLALLHLDAAGPFSRTFGVATSGTSEHRWAPGRHHLIDPRTGRPASSDVVQATVVSTSARRAEALAKAVVILGSAGGFAMIEQLRPIAAIALLDDGQIVASVETLDVLMRRGA